ncbi:MAG TPA: protein kinase [Pyrinomonadaceae bacterium]
MIRCHECDSQVAENDLFCPFCGTKLAPPAGLMPENSAVPEKGNQTSGEEGLANATTEQNLTDVPIPEILTGVVGSGPASSEPSAGEPILVDEHVEPTGQMEDVAEDVAPIDEPSHEPSGEGPGIFEERTIYKDESISKPLQEFEQSDPHASRSMFDSVRIMENKRQDDVDTRIQGISDPRPEAPMPAILSETAKSEPKPYTEPNMGLGGDTDGKRKKLKPLSEGTILNGRYEIVRKIGGGGMGAVYLASDNNLGGVLRAVKEMVQSHIEEEQQEKAINDFKRESMILSTLDHPSIPTIYDYFYDADEGRFYLVMKYISGGDLASRLRSAPEGKIDEGTVTEWAIQITDVLAYLHNQPSTIVYRDLKPSNIMIDGNSGRVMLIDFGIARSISQKEEKGVTAVGTMGYAPPELFSGNVEPRSDIYSLGSTMFHLLTGADPQSNPLLIFDFQKNPRPRQINSQLSDQIERIIMRSVEYNAESRFKSTTEMKSVLEEHLVNLRSGNVSFGVSAVPASVSLENQSVYCGFCGQRIVATDLFCAFCGAKQPIAQQGVHSEIYARSTPTAKLIIEGTSELTTPAFSLQKDENLVGRRDPMSNIFPEIDLSKYDPQTKISRRHARIWREGTNFLVEDLGSSNGTVLATMATESLRLVPHKPHVLSSGDKLKVGDTTLHFLIG